ncbi:ABC transporter G family protein [Heterostelium album PN500]|uniref:ABC transporter G family protein n=1 Tax=Heterostelium pallidum (strain ATCC 26659 / Pp 5 / PN500) TaxID=670386 RepID=D3AXR5_HETP5|nr:ABC transporter G family protein [Heterostelium album PN500]EFA85742.1 ABC transporter G family protein [Heterostelium album PN500]|eukprot:XP_020437848.1 ABC transporter G family protein [Heterostelium album PN500]
MTSGNCNKYICGGNKSIQKLKLFRIPKIFNYDDLFKIFMNYTYKMSTLSNTILLLFVILASFVVSANTLNIESCDDTTFVFNNVSSPCGVTDCYSVWGQGVCQTTANGDYQCICNPLYNGDQCQYNNDTTHNWDIMNCQNGGRFCPPTYSPLPVNRTCVCPPTYQGVDCSVCTSNTACSSGYECDNSIYIYQNKSYSCLGTSQAINQDFGNANVSVSMQCGFTGSSSSNTGSCNFNIFYKPTGEPKFIGCQLSQCTVDIDGSGVQHIKCESTACKCTTYCSIFITEIINEMVGPSEFDCQPNGNCVYSQDVFNAMFPEFSMNCHAGECRPQE